MSDVAAATLLPSACQASQPPKPAASTGPSLWSHGGFSFKDLLDIVNPLQHLPVIGSIYRYLTGDEPSGGARIVGDAIYGGPIGFGVGVVTTMLTDRQGEDLGEQVLASVFGPSSAERANEPSVAKSTPTAAQVAARSASLSGSTLPVALAAQGAGASHGNANTQTPAQAVRLAAKLYRSPATPTPSKVIKKTATHHVMAKNPRFERQMTTTRTADGRVLNNHPVPLELSSNLLPPTSLASTPAHPAVQPKVSSPPMARSAATGVTPDTNPIARKMLEALDKYEQLKKKQEQEDNAKEAVPPKVDLSL